jgi:hypothetical protein
MDEVVVQGGRGLKRGIWDGERMRDDVLSSWWVIVSVRGRLSSGCENPAEFGQKSLTPKQTWCR